MKNAGKPIYDPFAGKELPVGAPEERREYEVHRRCGHCNGSGRKRHDQTPGLVFIAACSQCRLGRHLRGRAATDQGPQEVWGRTILVLAFELTEAELNHLPPEKKLGALCEITQHHQQRRIARLQSDQANAVVVVARERYLS